MATGVDATALHLARRAALRRARGEARAARLRGCLPAAALALRGHGARRVLLFGSMTTGRATEASDVDLAVEGLAPERYFAALADVMAIVAGPVDLVRLEEAPESLIARIGAEGVEL
jgi:predicted nucleotidyltransferase